VVDDIRDPRRRELREALLEDVLSLLCVAQGRCRQADDVRERLRFGESQLPERQESVRKVLRWRM